MTLEQLIQQLEAVAKKNKDTFRYKIEIEPMRKGIQYSFICEEATDGHCLLSGSGTSIEAAVSDADSGMNAALNHWWYTA